MRAYARRFFNTGSLPARFAGGELALACENLVIAMQKQSQNLMHARTHVIFENTWKSKSARAARAQEPPERCAEAKCNVQKHMERLARKGDQGARAAGALCRSGM